MTSSVPEDDLDSMLPPNCPNPYYDTWDRHNSIAFSTATKGLRNAPGENNCFVNSAVQVFWHLDVFRRSYRRLSGHLCMGNSCIFCALKVIFTQFQFSDQTSLHPDALRKALAETFANQHRFQLGHMDDAAECFENILRRIHYHITSNTCEDNCSAPHCLPHQKFSLNITEKVVCPCGASSNPLKFNEMVHYISSAALVSQARLMQESGDTLHPDRFGLLLRNANAMGDIRDCPGSCGKKVQIRRTLLNAPDVVSIGLVWDSDHPSVETTTEVARNIGTTILMQDVFHSVMQDLRRMPKLHLVGLVCYYGKHYSTFVFHSKLQVWIYFDDATVREIGPRWENVVDKCSKGRYQPLLLLYANPKAEPISVESALKKRVMAPGYCIPGGPEEDSLDRTHESISSQQSQHRSHTPNPEPPSSQQAQPRSRSVTPNMSDGSSSGGFGEHSRQNSFLIAMSGKPDSKGKYHPRLGGQAAGTPGPMMPVAEHSHLGGKPQYPSQHKNVENYSDYTLSNSDQYRRPGMGAFDPSKLPLTPNMKGYNESPRKDSFKKKEAVRADMVRYQVDSPHQTQSQDSNQPPVLPPKTGPTPALYQNSLNAGFAHVRQRSLSQGGDEAYGSDSERNLDHQQQHTVVKPMAGNQNYDHLDGLSHSFTPVQSGLATLPRRKKESGDSSTGYKQYQETSDSRPSSLSNMHAYQDQRPGSNPKFFEESRSSDSQGLPPQAPGKSSASTSKDKKSDAEKKAKKMKKELKKAEKKKSRSDLSKIQADGSEVMPGSDLRERRPEEFRDDKIVYIDRRMVESILKTQGLQRSSSTHSTNSQNSNSSIESDSLMGRLLAGKMSEGGLHADSSSFDSVSIGSHKDSGYGSSDRNSSSSTGSGTIDPYTQYFISKSMVVPKNLNPRYPVDRPPQKFVSDFTAPNPQVYTASTQESQGKDLSGLSKEELNRHLYETLMQRKIMHPIKESSQEDMLKHMPQEHRKVTPPPSHSSSPLPTAEKEGRPPPIPPKNFAAFQVSKSSHHKEPSIDSLDKDEVDNDYFISMCEKADDLMDQCILAETQEDLTASLCYCDSALGCLKEAMNQTDISNKALTYAQKKHNSCLLKSRSLFKRNSGHGSSDGSIHSGKRNSITSTDSDNSDKPTRRVPSNMGRAAARSASKSHPTNNGNHQPSHHVKNQPQDISSHMKSPLSMQSQPIPTPGHKRSSQPGPQFEPSPSSSSSYNMPSAPGKMSDTQMQRSAALEASDFVHTRSSSNMSLRSSLSNPANVPQSMTRSQLAAVNAAQPQTISAGGPVPLDTYGTLPRNRKPRRTSDPTGNAEVYQMYLHRQKGLQPGSGSDTRESDSNGCDQTTNDVQRQIQQFNAGPSSIQESAYKGRRSLDTAGYSSRQMQHQDPMSQFRHDGHKNTGQTPMPQTSDNFNQNLVSQLQARQQAPDPIAVTGYNQPLPGHRGPNPYGASSSTSSYHGQQSHIGQQFPTSQTNLSQGNYPPSSGSRTARHSDTQHLDSSIQNLNLGVQNSQPNANSIRSSGPPPPPRTTSNPEFKQQPLSQPQPHHQQPNFLSQQYLCNSDSSSRTHHTAHTVARVEPNSHILQTVGSHPAQRCGQPRPMSVSGESILKHASSSTGLHHIQPRPLERFASQPDCQNLGETAYQTDVAPPPSFYPQGIHSSNSNNCTKDNYRALGLNGRLPQTSSSPNSHTGSAPTQATDDNEDESYKPNVRALASRFDRSADRHQVKSTRTRSKSESGKKTPKSILKSKKAKCSAARPRKSVIFAENTAGYESAAEMTTFTGGNHKSDRACYSDDEEMLDSKPVSFSDNDLDDVEDSSNSDDGPPIREELACQLCRKREMEPGKAYCSKCSFYMSRLVSS